jgi:hypothetical protein
MAYLAVPILLQPSWSTLGNSFARQYSGSYISLQKLSPNALQQSFAIKIGTAR